MTSVVDLASLAGLVGLHTSKMYSACCSSVTDVEMIAMECFSRYQAKATRVDS